MLTRLLSAVILLLYMTITLLALQQRPCF